MEQRNCFGRVFPGKEAEELGGVGNRRYHLCLKVIPMGDRNGADIAQQTPEIILQNHGCLENGTVIRYGDELPVGSIWEGVYVLKENK